MREVYCLKFEFKVTFRVNTLRILPVTGMSLYVLFHDFYILFWYHFVIFSICRAPWKVLWFIYDHWLKKWNKTVLSIYYTLILLLIWCQYIKKWSIASLTIPIMSVHEGMKIFRIAWLRFGTKCIHMIPFLFFNITLLSFPNSNFVIFNCGWVGLSLCPPQ